MINLCPPLHLGVVAFEKGAFRSSSSKVTNFTLLDAKRVFLFKIVTVIYVQEC